MRKRTKKKHPKINNLVAKYMGKFCKPTTEDDRKDKSRRIRGKKHKKETYDE